MNPSLFHHLQALGIQTWQLRKPIATDVSPCFAAHDARTSAAFAATSSEEEIWDKLQQEVKNCVACPLHQTRTQTVFGVGNQNADLLVIGEAPGFYEDKQGEPFVGRAGQLLNAMLQAIYLDRKQIYIANILKCRPPNNRDPLETEVHSCTSYLEQQIALIQPRLLLAVGRIAAHYLLKTKSSLESLRGKIHHFGENKTPLIVTFHPAYLLRNPSDKKKAFSDLRFAQKTLHEFK